MWSQLAQCLLSAGGDVLNQFRGCRLLIGARRVYTATANTVNGLIIGHRQFECEKNGKSSGSSSTPAAATTRRMAFVFRALFVLHCKVSLENSLYWPTILMDFFNVGHQTTIDLVVFIGFLLPHTQHNWTINSSSSQILWMSGQVWHLCAPGQGDSLAVSTQNTVTIVAGQFEGVAHVDRHPRQHGVHHGHISDAYEQQSAGTIVGTIK